MPGVLSKKEREVLESMGKLSKKKKRRFSGTRTEEVAKNAQAKVNFRRARGKGGGQRADRADQERQLGIRRGGG